MFQSVRGMRDLNVFMGTPLSPPKKVDMGFLVHAKGRVEIVYHWN